MKSCFDLDDTKNLDAILVLAGEYKSGRSDLAYQIYNQERASEEREDSPVYIIVSGSHSGFNSKQPEEPDSIKMKRYLVEHGVNPTHIRTENLSLDTLGNIIFSYPLIEDLGIKNLGIITDFFHAKRAQEISKRVYGNNVNVVLIPTEKRSSKIVRLRDEAYLWALNFLTRDIESGDVEEFRNFIGNKHPFYAKKSPLFYKVTKQLVRFTNYLIHETL